MRRLTLRAVGIGAVALAAAAPSAGAHIQVAPATAAPNDPIEVVVTVPNEESEASTTKVELQIPKGVLVFSVADTPGWKRTNVAAADGSIGQLVWTGKLASDGYAKFSFLASTPEQTGPISWKALQTYSNGTVARWIGADGAENPAAVTMIDADAPKQNAGGESSGGTESGSTATPGSEAASSSGGSVEPATADTEDAQARTAAFVALGVAIVGLLLAAFATLRGRRS